MKVSEIRIVTGRGADHVMLITTLPNPEYPFTGSLWLEFRAAKDTGEEFCLRHWPDVPIELIPVERP